MISIEDIDKCKEVLSDAYYNPRDDCETLRRLLEILAPGELLRDSEIVYIVEDVSQGTALQDTYGFTRRESAISLQLPTLYTVYKEVCRAKGMLIARAIELLPKQETQNESN